MKTAVVYYSLNGHTEAAAKSVALALQADLIPLRTKKAYPSKGFAKFYHGGKSALKGETPELTPYDFDAAQYDLIVIGTPVWASRFAPPIHTFIRDNRDALAGKPVAAFVCLGGSGGEKTLTRLKEALGIGSLAADMQLVDELGIVV